MIFAAVAAEICVFVAAASGCATGTRAHGFGDSPAASSQVPAKPLGTYAASASVTQKYGITEWRTYFGKNQMVVTGYRANGSAAGGMQFAWFAPAQGSVGHTRLTMLDGSGAVLRRLVGGGEDGHLSNEQLALVQTMRSDVAMGQKPAIHKLHATRAATYSKLDDAVSGPNMGPQCFEASTDPSTVIDASGCIVGAFTFETVVGGLMAMGSCAQWQVDNMKTSMTCDTENSQSCNTDTPPTCNYGQDSTTPAAPTAPQAQCDQACICANYGVYNGMPCSTTCTDNSACGSGQECHWGSCGPAASAPDSPTNQNVTQQAPGASSCSSGDVTPDPSTGQVGCSSPSGAAGSTGGSSGGGSGGSSSGTDTSGGDPATGSSGGGSSSGSGGGTGGQCADDGAGCSQDSDCCLGACGGGTCGASATGSSSGSGSSSGGGCAADGNACGQDSDCCGGSCDTSSGTCGSGTGSSSGGSSGSSSGGGCSADGSGCAQDSDCCGGSCDTSSGTCGSGSGSSSGGSSSGSSSGGGCAADGSGCAQDSDCCGGSCTSGTCGSGTTCGNPGDACGQDSDCCSGSCDTSAGACN